MSHQDLVSLVDDILFCNGTPLLLIVVFLKASDVVADVLDTVEEASKLLEL